MLPFPVLEELRDEGFTHYVIAPVPFAAGTVNALSWATQSPGGFSPRRCAFFRDILPTYAAVAELKALLRFIEDMLTTYVGAEPSQLILDGQIRRGDVRTITAAMMLIDLRDFTMLTDMLSPRAVIRLLNEYFDCVFPPVREHGGEVRRDHGRRRAGDLPAGGADRSAGRMPAERRWRAAHAGACARSPNATASMPDEPC